MKPNCPGPESWLALYGGELDEAESGRLARHLQACAPCQTAFDTLCDRGAQIAGAFASARVAAPRAARPRGALPVRRSRWGIAVAAAAAFVVALAGVLVLAPKAGRTPVAVKTAPAPAPPEPEALPGPVPVPPTPPAPRPPVERPVPLPPRPDPLPPSPVPRPVPPPEPVPAPEPRPAPVPPPPPTAPRTVAVAAALERVTGEVRILDEAPVAAEAGQAVGTGQGVHCVGKESAAVVAYADGTRFELGPDAILRDVRDRQPPGSGRPVKGKSAFLAQGTLTARVPRQPAGEPLVISTPHGESRVLGTTFKLVVEAGEKGSTRLEVREGKVRLTRRGGRGADVAAGQFAVAAPGAEPVARPIPRAQLLEDFEDPRIVGTRWEVLKDGFPAALAGNLEIDLSPRPADFYAKEKNGPIGGAVTRASFRLPVRVSADVEITWDNSGLWAAIFFVPAEEERPGLWVERSGTSLGAGWGGRQERVERPGGWPRRERWTAEFDAQEVRFSVNDREAVRAKHGLDPGEACRIRLEANGRIDSPRNARVRFDNVRVEELPPR